MPAVREWPSRRATCGVLVNVKRPGGGAAGLSPHSYLLYPSADRSLATVCPCVMNTLDFMVAYKLVKLCPNVPSKLQKVIMNLVLDGLT